MARLDKDTATGGRWAWARAPECWLAVLLAALLRLWHLELTQFLDDQTGMMLLARQAVLRHALPITGIPYSILTLSPPLSVHMLLPVTLFSADPLPAVALLALWNVSSVLLCYLFAHRYFGRAVAATSALLFATCGTAILYSRFLWPPNALPPVLVLWAMTLYAGAVRGRRRWFVPNVLLLLAAILLHPTTAVFIPITLVALMLAPVRPARWEWLVAAALGLLLLAPTLLFEVVSRGYDLRRLYHYARTPGTLDLDVLRALWGALDSPGAAGPAPISALAGVVALAPVLTGAVAGLLALGYLLLTLRVVARLWHGWRTESADARAIRARGSLLRRLAQVWHGLRTNAGWRADLLLWLWFTLPILALLHHSSPVYVHYLIMLYPVAFIVAAQAVRPLLRAVSQGAPSMRVSVSPPLRERWPVVARTLVLALLAVLVAADALRALVLPASLAAGDFTAYAFYGYPLSELQDADTRLAALQRQQRASATFLSLPLSVRYRAPMDYVLVGEHADRVSFADTCLVLPAPAAGPALIALTEPASPAGALLAALPTAHRVADLPLAGGAPWPVYRVQGALPPLPGEREEVGASFRDSAGNGLRLDAATLDASGVLRLRWTVLSTTPASGPRLWYLVHASAPGAGSATLNGRADCQPQRWRAGETLFTWLTLVPGPYNPARAPASGQLPHGQLLIAVRRGTLDLDLRSFGPLRFLTALPDSAPLVPLPASASATLPGTLSAEGSNQVPLRLLTP